MGIGETKTVEAQSFEIVSKQVGS